MQIFEHKSNIRLVLWAQYLIPFLSMCTFSKITVKGCFYSWHIAAQFSLVKKTHENLKIEPSRWSLAVAQFLECVSRNIWGHAVKSTSEGKWAHHFCGASGVLLCGKPILWLRIWFYVFICGLSQLPPFLALHFRLHPTSVLASLDKCILSQNNWMKWTRHLVIYYRTHDIFSFSEGSSQPAPSLFIQWSILQELKGIPERDKAIHLMYSALPTNLNPQPWSTAIFSGICSQTPPPLTTVLHVCTRTAHRWFNIWFIFNLNYSYLIWIKKFTIHSP